MIKASLIIVLDKVRISNGALMIILCGSWSIGTIGQGHQRVNTHITQVVSSELSPEVVVACTKLFSALCYFSELRETIL